MNWSQWTHDRMSRCRSSVMLSISSNPRTSEKNRQMSVRLVSSSMSADKLIATWLNRGLPLG